MQMQSDLKTFVVQISNLIPDEIDRGVGTEGFDLLEFGGFHEIDEPGAVLSEQLLEQPRRFVNKLIQPSGPIAEDLVVDRE
jgi:hypothetical protein